MRNGQQERSSTPLNQEPGMLRAHLCQDEARKKTHQGTLGSRSALLSGALTISQCTNWASQVALVVKNPPANAGDIRDTSSIPGSGRSFGEGHSNLLQYSWLENPMDRGAWPVIVHGVRKSRIQLKQLSMQEQFTKWPQPLPLHFWDRVREGMTWGRAGPRPPHPLPILPV